MEIKFLETDGPKRFEWIEPVAGAYARQRARLNAEFNFLLPPYKVIRGFGPIDDLRVLLRTVGVFIKFRDSSWFSFTFWPGFVTDLASVPRGFRGVVDNDEFRLLSAVLCHDFLFSTHALPFGYTNDLFHQMALDAGYNRFRAWVAKTAVSSYWGRKAWRANKIKRQQWTLKTAMLQLPRPIHIDGRVYSSTE